MFIWRLPKDKYQHAFYRSELQKHGIIQSMSRKGNCYDNCIMETFFGRLKNEMFYGFEKDYPSFEAFSKAIVDYQLLTMLGVALTDQIVFILLCCSPLLALAWCYVMYQISYRIFVKQEL